MLLKPLIDVLTNIENLKINVSVYENVVWCYDRGELTINTDKSVEDLYDRDGNTYSWEVRGKQASDDGYVVFFDANNGCGSTDTVIVKLSEKIDE